MNRIKQILYFIFRPNKFIEISTDDSINKEFKSNTALLKHYPDRVLPPEKREEFKQGAKEATTRLRRSIINSFSTLLVTIFLSLALSFILCDIIGINISARFTMALKFISASLIFWGVWGKLGWEIQTWHNDTLPEHINNLWYKSLYLLGVFLLLFSYFSELFSK